MPSHGNAVVEFLAVLRMNLVAVVAGFLYTLFRRHGCELHGIQTKDVSTQQYAFASAVKAGTRIADIGDGQVGVGDAAVDMFILFPEAAFELQAAFNGGGEGNGAIGGGKAGA